MGKYTAKFLKQTFVIIALAILFVAWQTYQNPEGMFLHYLFGGCLMILGTLFNGFMAVLTALEDKEEEEEKDENKKEILKG